MPKDSALRSAFSALQKKYRAPGEYRRGEFRLLTFSPRLNVKAPEFRVAFSRHSATTMVDGVKFMFYTPQDHLARDYFLDWKRLEADEHLSWLKSPDYLTMILGEKELAPKYFTALTRIILAAYYADIIQRSRERFMKPPQKTL